MPDPLRSRPASSSSSTPASTSTPAPAAMPPPQPQFHRFRLTKVDFRNETPASANPGQCSRFRVTDFIPWGAAQDGQNAATAASLAQPNSGGQEISTPITTPAASATGKSGSFSVMHMDVDNSAPQLTSSSVAAAGGSGRGMLQRVTVPAQQAQPRQMIPTPSPFPPRPPVFDPTQYPEEVRVELARVIGVMQSLPAEVAVRTISDALLSWPTLVDGSLLRRMGEVFPPPPPPPTPPQPEAQVPQKRKRGRPRKDASAGSTPATGHAIVNTTPGSAGSMAPPAQPAAAAQGAEYNNGTPGISLTKVTVAASKKDKESFLTCTRCLKPFNPAWRPTPASDPSSEVTCAVRHPFPDFQSGLVPSAPPRRKNQYKTNSWRWKCCGREVQTQSDDVLEWPNKDDDKTHGWCFVGKHTTEPDVREKLGLKPGKGRLISDELPHIKRPRLDESVSNGQDGNTGSPDQSPAQQYSPTLHTPSQPQAQQVSPQQPQSEQRQAQESTELPPLKRKRGRPKGSKSKNKMITVPAPTSESPDGQLSNSPGAQLMAESSQHHDDDEPDLASAVAANGDPGGSSFWTTYTEPSHLQGLGHDGEDGHMGMSSVDLGLLVSATAAMGGEMNGMGGTPQEKKRGRGRPKGVKNGAGRAAMEKKRQQLQEQQESRVVQDDGQHVPEHRAWQTQGSQHQQHQQHQQQQQQESRAIQDDGQHIAEQNLATGGWGSNMAFSDDHGGWGAF